MEVSTVITTSPVDVHQRAPTMEEVLTTELTKSLGQRVSASLAHQPPEFTGRVHELNGPSSTDGGFMSAQQHGHQG